MAPGHAPNEPYDRLRQIALYLLCWGEAAQVRFVPECLCFIFKCADDYYRSPECQNRQEPVPEGLYLRSVVKPLYRFLRDQGYEVQDGKFVRHEKVHEDIIGYDDVNQLFWYPEGIARITLNDRTRLVDLPPAQRFMKFDKVDWNRAFFKTYKEKRTALQLLVHFNRIWILHISLFWYYTAYNSPVIYCRTGVADATAAMKWSASMLGGAVSTVIMMCATLAEFTFIPTTWNNTLHLSRRLIFLPIVLGLNTGPSFYVFIANDSSDGSSLPLILAIVQFFIAVIATLLFSIIPSGCMFGDRVASKSRKYLASQNRLFGTGLCSNHAAFTLAIMFIMDLVLFFLNTYLWYVVWSAVFSTAHSFVLGLSIWTPWKDIFTRLPKCIYTKVLATGDMEVKYKPKVLVLQVWNAALNAST
ncbi:1,3-beta-glucan synthase, partial [Rhizoctonia solani AG-3 Rhs1AP]